jgi:hypothetical protein
MNKIEMPELVGTLAALPEHVRKCVVSYGAACAAVATKFLQSENAELKQMAERLKLEAQAHAQEARTANSTIAEIYQVISGASGEPGNWNGAEPVREYLAELKRQLEEAQKDAEIVDYLETQCCWVGLRDKLDGVSPLYACGGEYQDSVRNAISAAIAEQKWKQNGN